VLVDSRSAESSYSRRRTEIAFLVLGRTLCSRAPSPALGYAGAKSKRGAHLRLRSQGSGVPSRAPAELRGASPVGTDLAEPLPAAHLRLPSPERGRKEPCGDSAVAPAPGQVGGCHLVPLTDDFLC